MPANPPDDNPYSPPPHDAANAAPSQFRARWRLALVTLLLIFALIGLAGVPITIWVAHRWPVERGGGLTVARLGGALLQLAGSVLIGWCGLAIWKARWRVAAIIFGAALAALAMSRWLLADLPL